MIFEQHCLIPSFDVVEIGPENLQKISILPKMLSVGEGEIGLAHIQNTLKKKSVRSPHFRTNKRIWHSYAQALKNSFSYQYTTVNSRTNLKDSLQ